MSTTRTKVTVEAHCAANRQVHVATNSPSSGGWFNLRDGESRVVELESNATLTVREMDLPKTASA